MSLKVKSNGTSKYVLQKDDLNPAMTNFTSTAGPKVTASEATVTKIGPFAIVSFIVKATAIINANEVILNLPTKSTANFALGIQGNSSLYGAQVSGSSLKTLNPIPSGEWLRGQILYPTDW